MIQYNYAAELASFVIISILLLNLFLEKEPDSRRNRFFKGIVLAIFLIVVFTLISTYMTMDILMYPIWLVVFAVDMYFISLPLALVMGLLYVKSLKRSRNTKAKISLPTILLMAPYALYVIFVIANYFSHYLFSISYEFGYVRGNLYLLPYPVALFYIVAIFIEAFRSRNSIYRGIGFVICINVVVMSAISFSQLIFPEVLLSGLANVAGALVVFLYIQNVTRSTDSLTGFHNRVRLAYDVEKRVSAYARKKGTSNNTQFEFSLVLYSLRNIKGINERYGLLGGDELLEGVAVHLRQTFKRYHVYRYSGDEFAVLMDKKYEEKEALVHKAAERFEKPFFGESSKKEMTVKVVYAQVDFPEFGTDPKPLVSALDYSISSLKHGKYRTNFMHDLTICEKMSRRNSVIDRIKYALENDGFEVNYQPIYSTQAKTFKGAEALLRMKKELGSIYPDEFIPLAEETGLIVNMTYMVLEKVCADLRSLLDRYGSKLDGHSISINFPSAQFLEQNLVSKIMQILGKYDICPEQIKIEITERTLIGDAGLISGVMREMQEKGFVFEVDDFGVDYSNISLILHLPVEIIKIDRSLVLLATEKERYEDFFRFFLKAIRHTDRKVVIEGVETKEQADFFISCGSEYIQGFYYAHPMPYDDCIKLLDDIL